jgi:hypothetical protein
MKEWSEGEVAWQPQALRATAAVRSLLQCALAAPSFRLRTRVSHGLAIARRSGAVTQLTRVASLCSRRRRTQSSPLRFCRLSWPSWRARRGACSVRSLTAICGYASAWLAATTFVTGALVPPFFRATVDG